MSDTYNPNEIAKVKHLDELARQLAIKLDGGTDPKLDFSPTVKTWNLRQSDGSNFLDFVTGDDLKLNLNAGGLNTSSGFAFPFYLAGLSIQDVPLITITKSKDNFLVAHRSTSYGGPSHPQYDMRGLWDIGIFFTGYGNIVVGDFFTIEVNVHGNDTYNPYTRTITYRFVEWQE